MNQPESQPTCPIDAHVHFHSLDRVSQTLDSAADNFRVARMTDDSFLGMLLLTQTANELVFESLRECALIGNWRIVPASEESVTLIAHRGGDSIGVVCGRQLRTAEGLEVLALGTSARFPDRLSLEESVTAVHSAGAVTVLPWAFGKWTGARGRRIDSMLDPSRAAWLFVGDNGGRLSWAGVPRLLRVAERRGFRVLPGTDPFPIADDHRRVGSFGFHAETCCTSNTPWRALRDWLMSLRESPVSFGRTCAPLRFLRNQIRIRLRH